LMETVGSTGAKPRPKKALGCGIAGSGRGGPAYARRTCFAGRQGQPLLVQAVAIAGLTQTPPFRAIRVPKRMRAKALRSRKRGSRLASRWGP
jgi:hypothetical protein